MNLPLNVIQQSAVQRIAPLKALADSSSLLINEIYFTIQGESTFLGLPCVMIRTTGCHLRCHYCDTSHAFFDGTPMSLSQILENIQKYKCQLVEITGGEPLLQKGSFELTRLLCDAGYKVLIETSGTISAAQVDQRAVVIFDIKTPASGESSRNCWKNFENIPSHWQVKFVICDHNDYLFAKETIEKYQLLSKCVVLFSAAYQRLSLEELADWIIDDALNVRLQPQLHKVIWGNKPKT